MFLPVDSSKIVSNLLTYSALVLSLSIPAPAWAQVAGATLSGTVTDASGAVIPQAQVYIKNTATGISTAVTVNSHGLYTAPNLLPGTYEMTASAPGFATEVRSGITLTVGVQQLLDLTMHVGQVTEKVQVTGEAPAVELATSSISAVVNGATVRQLPLNGRSWTDLATLQPGEQLVVPLLTPDVTYCSSLNSLLLGTSFNAKVSCGRPPVGADSRKTLCAVLTGSPPGNGNVPETTSLVTPAPTAASNNTAAAKVAARPLRKPRGEKRMGARRRA